EDGIRDFHVTGVQTCALPISCELTAMVRRPLRTTMVRSIAGRNVMVLTQPICLHLPRVGFNPTLCGPAPGGDRNAFRFQPGLLRLVHELASFPRQGFRPL